MGMKRRGSRVAPPTPPWNEITGHLVSMICNGMIEIIHDILVAIVKQHGNYWPQALHAVRSTLDHADKMPADIRAQVESLEKLLLPTDLENQLRQIVSNPDWRHKKEENGHFTDISAIEAEKLAEDLASQGTSWYDKLPIIFRGEQRQGYTFGRHYGTLVEDPGKFIDASILILQKSKPDESEPIVLGAFLSALQDHRLVSNTLDRVARDDCLVRHFVILMTLAGPESIDLDRLSEIVENKKLRLNQLSYLTFGRALDHLSEQIVTDFCERMSKLGPEASATVLDVLYMYCHGRDDRFYKCESTFKKILMVKEILDQEKTHFNRYSWMTIAERLLRRETQDQELAVKLCHDILSVCRNEKFMIHDIYHAVRPVVISLFKFYPSLSWPVFADVLLGDQPNICYNLKHLLGIGFDDEANYTPITDLPYDLIYSWCKDSWTC